MSRNCSVARLFALPVVSVALEDVAENPLEMKDNFKGAIAKARKIVKLFRRSPMKNDLLQQIQVSDTGKAGLQLILDTQTRWNSLLSMIKRLLEVRKSVSKALVELEMQDLMLTESEVLLLDSLSDALDVIETASLALGRRDCTLFKSERIFKYLLKQLSEQQSCIGNDLYEEVRGRILERRQRHLAGNIEFFLMFNKFFSLRTDGLS